MSLAVTALRTALTTLLRRLPGLQLQDGAAEHARSHYQPGRRRTPRTERTGSALGPVTMVDDIAPQPTRTVSARYR